jgi:hypothetical protein
VATSLRVAALESANRSPKIRTLMLEDPRLRGEIKILYYLRPLVPVRKLALALLSEEPGFSPLVATEPELFITAEGEYAALYQIAGRQSGASAARIFGMIFGDDFTHVVSARVLEESQLDYFARLVRHLTYHEPLQLGVRRRRFLYEPPPGWVPRAQGLITHYYPPDFPKAPFKLTVHPAAPREGAPEALFVDLHKQLQKQGFVASFVSDPEPITSDFGLHGQTFCLVGAFPSQEQIRRDLVILQDGSYSYALLLESGAGKIPAPLSFMLSRLVRSVRPVPPPRPTGRGQARAPVQHWLF